MTAAPVVANTPENDGAVTATEEQFSVTLRMYQDYAQVVDFGPPDQTLIALDEPHPVGRGYGPNPARMLASAVGGCLGASLLYCFRKARIDVAGLSTKVEGTLVRNERGRLRIGALRVTLAPTMRSVASELLTQCFDIFEDFGVVTQSVRDGIDVDVRVEPVGSPDLPSSADSSS